MILTSDIIALALLLIVVIFFILHAFRARSKELTVESHMLGGRTTSRKMFGASFVVTSTSLATVLMFFLLQSELYGLILLIAGLTFLLGQWFFLSRINVSNIETKDMTSNADFWLNLSGGRKSAVAISLISFISFIIIFFVELYIGSVILSKYFGFLGQNGAFLAFIVLGLLTITYVQMGGFKAIIKTDFYQATLVFLAVLGILIFSIILPSQSGGGYIGNIFNFTASSSEIITLLVVLFFLNFATPFSQVTFWQRVASSPSKKEAFKGFKRYIPLFLFIWLVPVISFKLLNAKGFTFDSIGSFFAFVQSTGGISEFILFPIIFVGLAAALFSTADSALIAIQFSLVDNTMFKSRFDSLSRKSAKNVLIGASLVIVMLLSLIYYLAESQLVSWFIPLIFAIFGVLVVVSPLIIFGLVKSQKNEEIRLTKLSDSFIAIGLYLGGFSVLATTFIAVQLGSATLSQLATLVGVIISLIFLIIGLSLRK